MGTGKVKSAAARSHSLSHGATPSAGAALKTGFLYIVATPIGNLGDLSPRATATLKSVATIACEDTRVTGGMLHRLGISTPMIPYHDHNAERMRPQILARIGAGESIALVSDAGTPLISDPGYKLVKDCVENGINVVPIPGPSAPLAALMAAGLPTDRFYFGGFLPNKTKARRAVLVGVKSLDATLVYFESPHRLGATLLDMAETLGEREAAVGREITKLHEEFKRGNLISLSEFYRETRVRGEVVIVVGAGGESAQDIPIDIDAALIDALKTLSVRDAADAVAKAAGASRREVYSRALKVSKNRNG